MKNKTHTKLEGQRLLPAAPLLGITFVTTQSPPPPKKSLIKQWLSNLSSKRRDPCDAESHARRQAARNNPASSLPSSATTSAYSSAETAPKNQLALTYDELQDIENRSQAYRRFLVGGNPLPVDSLSDEARLAIVDVQRLIKMCRALMMPNDQAQAQPPSEDIERKNDKQ